MAADFLCAVALGLGAMAILAGCQTAVTPPSRPSLTATIQGADRLEVRRGAGAADNSTLLVVRAEDAGQDFLQSLRPGEWSDGPRCECGQAHVIRFFKGDRLLTEVIVQNARQLRWPAGDQPGETFIAGEQGRAFHDWFRRNGGSPGWLFLPAPPGVVKPVLDQIEEASREFVACFPVAAAAVVNWIGPMRTMGWEPGRESSNLREFVPDGVELARAAFRAFGNHPLSWQEDDFRTSAIQTAVAALPPDEVVRAFRSIGDDDRSLRGAARLLLRMGLTTRFDAAFKAAAIPAMADAMLRTGEARDKAVMLLYLAATKEPEAMNFLREVATGQRTYPWTQECRTHYAIIHEPSLVASAAMLLALDRNQEAGRLVATGRPVFDLDDAARRVTASLLDPGVRLRAADLRHESRLLGYCAAEAMVRQRTDDISAPALSTLLVHNDHWGPRRIRPLATSMGLAQYWEPSEVNLYAAPVQQRLAAENPAEAIRQCTEHLGKARGLSKTALLLIRAVAYEARHQSASAIADYEAALKAGGYSAPALHEKLAWLKFYQGRFGETIGHIEHVLRAKPDPNLFFLRGLIAYASDDFSPNTEMNFTVAIGLLPAHGYASIFQHLTSVLGDRPALSRLRTPYAPKPTTQSPTTITLSPTAVQIDTGIPPEIPWWPASVLALLHGEIDGAELLTRARRDPSTAMQQVCEAHFYLAQLARLDGRRAEERAALAAAVQTEAIETVEYHVAKLRLRGLQE
jgi:hypothetical protein